MERNPFVPSIPDEDKQLLSSHGYDVAGYLGSGSIGLVFSGVCNPRATKVYSTKNPFIEKPKKVVSLNGKSCAIKWLRPDNTGNPSVGQNDRILSELNHQNIVEYYFAIETKDRNIYIITEYMNGGDVTDFLLSGDVGVDEVIATQMITDLCEGLQYLHSKQVVHRDIHTANVMLLMPTNPFRFSRLKYVDFSFAKVSDDIYDYLQDIQYLAKIIDDIICFTTFTTFGFKESLLQITDRMRKYALNDMKVVYNQFKTCFPSLPGHSTNPFRNSNPFRN